MDAFAAAIDALFIDPNIARDARWRPGGEGAGIVVRIVTKRPDKTANFGDSRVMMPTMLIDVRRAEIPAPSSGDTFEMDSETFEIIATPIIDSLRLVWTCEAAPPV